ncbi:MAG: GNAT family N-acetyltransferase [Eubacteriales bacterium]|nr:GNAT family N-acetyltransferase [Eubacteriales bacterium]
MIRLVYELKDTSKVKKLFEGRKESMIYSCLQNVMGKIYVTDLLHPVSAFAFVGCFSFFAGKPDRELVANKPDKSVIMIPQNDEWSALIEECYPSAKRIVRYAIKKGTIFDAEKLRKEISKLPSEYELRKIDSLIYNKCLENPVTADFVSAFESKEQYLKIGRGMVIIKDENIVSGASSYTRYNEGIEIEVDTVESERRKHLATIACSALILECLNDGLYPSWDAHNMNSVHLAEKLGYEFDHEYTAYEIATEAKTH